MTFSLIPFLLQQPVRGETTQGGFWFPVQGSEAAAQQDEVFMALFYLIGFSFLVITVAAAYLAIKYRKSKNPEPQPSPSHNNTLEIVWTAIPSVLMVWVFYVGLESFVDS